jgi:TPR repeat protein
MLEIKNRSSDSEDGDAAYERDDYPTARLAAEQGDADAQSDLGVMYLRGQGGVAQDYREAEKWFRLAAEQGNADAKKFLKLVKNALKFLKKRGDLH